jgi:intermediate filament protein if
LQTDQLEADVRRITDELDREILTRVELENQKQTLQEEMNFLRQIHSFECERFRHASSNDDAPVSFRHELANAVRNIRQEYEQTNQQQREQLQLWYQTKVEQAV